MASDTRQRIVDTARLTVQDRGYAGLSFRELAKDVGIKSASIHHYFPNKGMLGGELTAQTTIEMEAFLAGLVADGLEPKACMDRYVDVFRSMLVNENRMCVAGIMAAEYSQLPEEVREEVVKYTALNVRWLSAVLAKLDAKADPAGIERRSLAIFAAVEGAQLVARSREDVAAYDAIIDGYRDNGLLP